MKNVLYQLYDGELSRTDLLYDKGTPYARAFESVTATEADLIGALTQDQRELLEAHFTAIEKLNAIARREDFAAGFQMGARIMAAIMDSGERDIHHSGGR